MNKTELVKSIAIKMKSTQKDAENTLNTILNVISDALVDGEKIQIVGFGSFEVSTRGARKGRNPQTGEKIDIAESKVPKFKAGKGLKDAVNK